MAENRKDIEASRYYFSKSQLALVTTGFVFTCILVFLLGLVVGQGVEERKLLKQEEPLAKVPIQPPASTAKPSQGEAGKDDQLTFYDTLSKGGGAAPAKEPPAEKAAKMKSSAEVEPPVKEGKTVKAPVPAPEPPPAAKDIKTAKAALPEAVPVKKEKVEKAPEKVDTAAKTAEDEKAKSDAPRDWMVQINAYPDERSAQRLADRLKQKGYDAYVVTANIKGHDWYRVRIGHFPTRTQAKEYLEQIQTKETKENFTKAIAVSK
jgi:cell division protein FtsN